MMRGRSAGLVVCALLLALAGCAGDAPAGSGEVLARHVVERGPLDIVITESGQLKSARPTSVTARVNGKVLWVVAEGATVKKGDKVLELENRELAAQIESTKQDLDAATRARANAERDARLYELEAGKLTADAERQLRFAKLALEQYTAGKAPLRRQELELAVERAQTETATAREKHERMPVLSAKGFVTAAEVRDAELEAREKAAQLGRKQRELEIWRTYEHPQELAKLEADVAAAELGVERTAQQIATQRAQKDAEVQKQRDFCDRHATKLKDSQDQYAQLLITAPGDGIVVYGDERSRRWGGNEERLDIGVDVQRNRTVMSLPDLGNMVAEVGVTETNVSRVRVGMPAVTRVEGLADRAFTGTVERIATTAKQEWYSDMKRYATTVSLGDIAGATFRPGMSVKVEIRVERIADAVSVPIDAISADGTAQVCWVEAPGGPQRRVVELGASTEARVVVTKGLSAGETVLVLSAPPGR